MYAKHDKEGGISQTQSTGKQILVILKANRDRVLAVCFVIYLIALVRVGSAGGWSLEHGFEWPSPGYQLFPIPINWHDFGFGSATVMVPMGIADIVLYVVFVGNLFWLIWGAFAITYIFYPAIIIRIKNRILRMLNRSP